MEHFGQRKRLSKYIHQVNSFLGLGLFMILNRWQTRSFAKNGWSSSQHLLWKRGTLLLQEKGSRHSRFSSFMCETQLSSSKAQKDTICCRNQLSLLVVMCSVMTA